MESNQTRGTSASHRAPLRDLCAMLCLLPKTADPYIDVALGALLACIPPDDAGDVVAPHHSIASVGALLADLGEVLLYSVNSLALVSPTWLITRLEAA